MTSKTPAKNVFLPVILVFIFTNALLLGMKSQLAKWDIDQAVTIIGNLILFIVTFVSLTMYQRAMKQDSTSAFLRNTYSGLLVKLLVCMAAVLVYAMVVGNNINKGAIFTCMFLYFLYTFIEIRSLMRWNKERKNA
jgi:hypothetical protein